MGTAEFDKFDLEGLSLEDIEPVKTEKPEDVLEIMSESAKQEPIIEAKPVAPVEQEIEAAPPPQVEPQVQAQAPSPAPANAEESTQNEDQMICPKCELEQPKAEQCAGCGVYVAKASAQIGQSKIEITSTKF